MSRISLAAVFLILSDACVECIAIVEIAADKHLGDCSSGFRGDPLEDLSEQAEHVEEGQDGAYSVVHRERGVEDDA
ncbi:hypothetical protein NDU88_001250 [Pleurodeles waltl]|uniref:Secreted protein n=1 Tax=Pleurodeles waltl TaxID=8319 RepID=A0AAV7WLW7_PLEWA|nr:hypothetical protein NDU88_001250 [Pleurodeles waltl]